METQALSNRELLSSPVNDLSSTSRTHSRTEVNEISKTDHAMVYPPFEFSRGSC